MRPSDQLDEYIHMQEIIKEMNTRNCFDFDYSPQEEDTLHFDNGKKHPEYAYFSLIYRNNMWQEGNNPAFTSRKTQLAEGIVKNKAKGGGQMEVQS